MPSAQIPDPLISQVQALISRGQASQAIAQLQPVCNRADASSEHWFFYGVALAESGKLIDAVPAFEKSAEINPASLQALTNLGKACIILQQPARAVEPLKRARLINPLHKPASIQLVTAYIALQQFAEAEAICDELYAASPYDAEILQHYGIIKKLQNDFLAAIAFFDQALAMQPGAIPVMINKALALQSAGRVDDAISLLQEVTEKAPTMAQAWHIMAMAWLAKADLEHVILCFEKAFELDPGNIEAGIQLAKSYRHVGRTTECEAACKKILEVDPDNAEALFFQNAYSKQSNQETLDRIPAEVTRQMYQGKAGKTSLGESFNKSLTTSLEYKAPDVLNNAVRDNMNLSDTKLDILELGCGSGLCGSKFSDIANTLIGTDISPDMLEGAKEKNAYTELYEADLIDALSNYDTAVDLVIAMDVLCFFGDLTDIFERCRKALRSNGVFGFSVVKPKTDAVFELQTYGHFVHSLEHLRLVAERTGFHQLFSEELVLRRELNLDQFGYVCLFQRS